MRRLLGTISLCAALAIAAMLGLGTLGARASSRTPAPQRDPAAGSASSAAAVGAVDDLAVAMLRHLNPGGDTIASPLSVATALAMVDQGASGQTAAQLDHLLGSAASPAAVAGAFAALARQLDRAVGARGGPALHSANALWLQSGLALEPGFAHRLSSDFGAAPRQVAFSSDPAGALQTINGWVAARTHGLIPALLSPADITPQTNLVLADAIYLQAAWQSPFNPSDTQAAGFETPGGRVSVPFMSDQQLDVPYGAGAGYQAVALPYAHSSLQFLAVMPAAGSIGAFTRALSSARLAAIAVRLAPRRLALEMPKFTLSAKADLDGFLQGQGVADAFGPGSQLDRMVSGRRLSIAAVVHQATLEVAEKGTVAAAATGVSLAPTAVEASPFTLRLDHPFLIFIRDSRTGTILFCARVLDPTG